MYTFLLCNFYNFYYVYLKILRFKICFENCANNKREQKRMEGVINNDNENEFYRYFHLVYCDISIDNKAS